MCLGGGGRARGQNKQLLDLEGAWSSDMGSGWEGPQRAGVSKSGVKGPGGMPNSGELSGTCLYHEGPSGRRVLDQLHLPRTKRHQSRHRLVSGAPRPKPQPPVPSLQGKEEGRLEQCRVCRWAPTELTSVLSCSPTSV